MNKAEEAVQKKTILLAQRFTRRLLADADVQIENWQNTHANWPKPGER
jgi:hypothetical protein